MSSQLPGGATPQGALDPRQIFAKTAAGQAEITTREHRLGTAERRILIMMDGHRRVGELIPLVRDGELAPILDKLRALNLVTLVGMAEGPAQQEPPPDPAKMMLRLARVQAALIGQFERELREEGRPFELALRECTNLGVAGRVIREGIDLVGKRRGQATADRLIAIARKAFADPGQG